ncbi:MAG: type I restriction enzyme HsdR N-terminal domain-containing protein [Bacteroidales bacterium]|jgi:hypothetical protein|nr:type I restriction enzyme HsdR N-terminal domain-containing protein [Bacteroidales bacterium]MDD2687569.1 type I restriction enzyme HsdR N-terminal domain-containing protein [Bacteroidales bacterium]MDD3330235.1 type I restriction enzyme HsdR N-terminal domain-containing protein [Bacteroidales bacterium]MDD3690994.1 type I restriction enzyme HsdR N-terminal domain-containing protein [Bacteroidales bacterium]MDD4044257.1 type I restriction enzyme HsdR N-terminal domain-containing protein [Bac
MQTEQAFRIRILDGKKQIFDPVRKMFVAMTPEEMVRQAYLKYLIQQLFVPSIAISVEKKVLYNTMSKRYDIVVVKPDGTILLAVECKAETVQISEATLMQMAMYNHELQAKYLVLFNGKTQIILQKVTNSYIPINELPIYKKMIE